MIEISTIQDIRQIESKYIGGFTGRQLLAIVIGGIIDIILYVITRSMNVIIVVSLIILFLGFFKKGNLTAIEYISVLWDKQKQPRIRNYKNKNVIFEIERQCRLYKSPKKKKSKGKRG